VPSGGNALAQLSGGQLAAHRGGAIEHECPQRASAHWADSADQTDVMNRGRLRLTISVANDSAAATIYVRDLDLRKSAERAGVPLSGMPARDEQIAPGQRLVRDLDLATHNDCMRYEDGFIVRAQLTDGQIVEHQGELTPQLVDTFGQFAP
jgi:hypothetical protein